MSPRDVALAFLAHLAGGRIDAARALLAPDVRMIFPGGVVLRSLDELAAWSRPRYRSIAKRIDRTDCSGATVHVSGTLEGTWSDGRSFSGIRFVDRFDVRDGLIARQEVWNDMAERRAGGTGGNASGGDI